MSVEPERYQNELEFLQSAVGRYFPIYKTEVEYDIVNLYVKVWDDDEIEEEFDDLRKDLVPKNYIPHMRTKDGEYIISVKKQPEKTYRSVKTNVIMLIITVTTALIAGTWWWSSYDPHGGFFSLHNISNGALFFTLPLLSILGIHEMGHYLMARYHDIKASLPFFLPAPPPLGTIGAFISIREPIPDKKSLLDVGVAGPICGFIVAIPVSIIGLYLGSTSGKPIPTGMEGPFLMVNFPLIFMALDRILPFSGAALLHPTAFAGWVGFLVTGLNLLPAGQLDGGHVVRSLLGEHAKYTSYLAAGFLLVVGIWKYPGWLIFALFLLFFVGLKHPPPLNDLTKLDMKRKAVGVVAVIMLFTCFHPVPINTVEYEYDFSADLQGSPVQNVSLNDTASFTFIIENTGEPNEDDYNVSYSITNDSWTSSLYILNRSGNNSEWDRLEGNRTIVSLEPGENSSINLKIEPVENSSERTDILFKVESNTTGDEKIEGLTVNLGYGFRAGVLGDNVALVEDNEANFTLSIHNLGKNDSYRISTSKINNGSWSTYFVLGDQRGQTLTVDIGQAERRNFTAVIHRPVANTRSMRFYLDEGTPSTRADVALVTASISIRSMGSGEEETFQITGVWVEE